MAATYPVPESIETVYDLLDVGEEDRVACSRLDPDPGEVATATASLRGRMGTFPTEPPDVVASEQAWIRTFLDLTPELVACHRERGVPEAVTRATLADFGRHLRWTRRAQGRFGLTTYSWITAHYTGSLFALGRLQYQLHQTPKPALDVPADAWVVGMHIPETGPLTPALVDESIVEATRFFATYFPEQQVQAAVCASWLLDPHLRTALVPTSNIARFAARFTLTGESTDAPSSALYFVFRTRDLSRIPDLVPQTRLEHVVIDRLREVGTWQESVGVMPWPA